MQHEDDGAAALACALAADSPGAARLLAESGASGPGDAPGELTAARRARLVQRALRLPAAGDGRPGPLQVSAPDLPEDLRLLQADLARLAPLPRTVLALRHHEHLALLEIAQLTERSPAAVSRALDAATAAVPAEPHLVELALGAVPRPEDWQLRAATEEVARRRRRSRGRLLVVAVAVAALVAAAVVLPGLLQPDPYTRARGEWVYTLDLPADAPFTVTGRTLSADAEVLGVDHTGTRSSSCRVEVSTTERPEAPPAGRSTTVARRPARSTATGLWWSLGPLTSAVASCDDPEGDEALAELAAVVRTRPVPVRLPFRLPARTAGQHVDQIYDYQRFQGVSLVPDGQDDSSPDAVFVAVPTFFPMPQDRRPRTVDVNGALGTVIRDDDGQWVCWPAQGEHACVGSFDQAQRPPDAGRQLLRLTRVARVVQAAPDLEDRATWFDAREALPR